MLPFLCLDAFATRAGSGRPAPALRAPAIARARDAAAPASFRWTKRSAIVLMGRLGRTANKVSNTLVRAILNHSDRLLRIGMGRMGMEEIRLTRLSVFGSSGFSWSQCISNH